MIIRKGTRVLFDLESGRTVKCVPGYGMMHDPDGADWPQNSVLVMPFRRTGDPIDYAPARHYFGAGHGVESGEVTLPPRALTAYTKVGHVKRIWYTRPGTSHPGPFKHKVNGGWLDAVLGKKRAILYRRGRIYRLEFPDGAVIDARGFVRP